MPNTKKVKVDLDPVTTSASEASTSSGQAASPVEPMETIVKKVMAKAQVSLTKNEMMHLVFRTKNNQDKIHAVSALYCYLAEHATIPKELIIREWKKGISVFGDKKIIEHMFNNIPLAFDMQLYDLFG